MKEEDIIKKLVLENVWKNILVIVIVMISCSSIANMLKTIEPNSFGNLLLVISILLVTVCFANFAFTYQNSNVRSFGVRMLSHVATFLFLLIIALLLVTMSGAFKIVYPSLNPLISTISILIYISIVLYDFWDIFRIS